MGMNVSDWYRDPAQLYNDVIFPQNEKKLPDKKWDRYDKKAPEPDKAARASEKGLSAAAQKLLDKLKKTYGNVDFSVAESEDSDEAKAKLAAGNKQYSVLLTNEELENMAKDMHYRTSMLSRMKDAFQEITKESERLKPGNVDAATGEVVKNLSVSCSIYGNYSVKKGFVDYEQLKPAEKTPMEKYQEKQAERKKEHRNKSARKSV